MRPGAGGVVGLWVALVAHLSLACSYAWLTPAFEAPDENGHFYYACFVAQRFPEQPTVLGSAAITGRPVWDHADLGHHPPAYYTILAAILCAVGFDDTMPAPRVAASPEGPLQFEHGYDETSARSLEVRLVFGLRLLSVLCGCCSVWLTWRAARTLWPEQPRIAELAAILLACLPQWSSAHGALDNGNLATTLSHLCIALLASALAQRRFSTRRALVVGVVVGIALLTKANSLALLPVLAVAGLALWLHSPTQRRQSVSSALLAAGVALAIFLPQVIRNLKLYGDPLGQTAHEFAFAASRLPEGSQWTWLLHGFLPGVAKSFVGFFGWWRVPLPGDCYAIAGFIGLLAILGWILGRRTSSAIPGRHALLAIHFR